jgi:hypothetical protein
MFWTDLRLHDAAITIASVCFVIASQVSMHRMGVATDAHDKRPCEQDKRRARGTFQTPNLGAAGPGTQDLVTGPSCRKVLGLCPCVDRKMVVVAPNKK